MDFKRRVLLGSGIIAGSFLVFGIIAYFSLGSFKQLAEKTAAERELAMERSSALENLSALKQQAPEAEALEKNIEALLPHEDGLFTFPEFMEGVARMHGVDISIAFNGQQSAPAAGAPGYYGFNATLSGDPQKLAAFLHDIEFTINKFVVSVDSLTFSSDGGTYHASITGRVFFQK